MHCNNYRADTRTVETRKTRKVYTVTEYQLDLLYKYIPINFGLYL